MEDASTPADTTQNCYTDGNSPPYDPNTSSFRMSNENTLPGDDPGSTSENAGRVSQVARPTFARRSPSFRDSWPGGVGESERRRSSQPPNESSKQRSSAGPSDVTFGAVRPPSNVAEMAERHAFENAQQQEVPVQLPVNPSLYQDGKAQKTDILPEASFLDIEAFQQK